MQPEQSQRTNNNHRKVQTADKEKSSFNGSDIHSLCINMAVKHVLRLSIF